MADTLKDKKDHVNKPSVSAPILDKIQGLLSNEYQSFLVKKAERLTSALYVVTGFMPPEEPLRKRLRSKALELIGSASDPASLSTERVERFKALCVELGVLFQTARTSGLVSPMNADILAEEYAGLASFVSEHSGSVRETSNTASDVSVALPLANTQSDKGHNFQYETKRTIPKRQKNGDKKQQGNRRQAILDLLDKKDRISIKDAVSVIGGVSEKTIQRELLSLVDEGVVLKEGERRWSTYKKVAVPVTL